MNPVAIAALQDAWPALTELLDEALALPSSGRDAWLSGLVGDSARHRDTLRDLLAIQAELETGDFLAELPSLRPERPAQPGAAPGRVVGPYRLISQIGQGGMATVWLAERVDGLIKRQVALKLPAVAWGEAFATRLAREREILGSLTHPHIARLYDAGVDALGRPFLAMEFIDGEPIDVFCRQRSLPLAERTELLLQVMAAVAHAHARLVVHRDLKPSNILVSASARVSLLDFGIAKLLEGDRTRESALTRAAGHALTPDYASPEQIAGESLGTASDVYSLAVVAYELLAGSRPYHLKRGSAAELTEAIAAVEPPLASVTAADEPTRTLLRGDLDAILNKALKKRPDERYPTMDAFAQDLRRWRDGEPVQARPDRWAYRATKYLHRHRLQAVAAGGVALALLLGTSLAVWQAREARLQAEHARAEAAVAKAVQAFIESVFVANSGNQDDPQRARATTARELLDRGAGRIERELANVPEAQLRLYQTMQEMYVHMALNDRAISMERRSLELATRLHGAESSAAVAASVDLAKTLVETNQLDEGRQLLLRAEAIVRAQTVPDARLRLFIDGALAALDFDTDPRQALVWARQGAALARGLRPTQDTINAFHMLGETANITGHLDEAQTALNEAAAQIAKEPQAGAGALPLVLGTLGEVQDKLGQVSAAGKTLDRAIALARRMSDPYTLHIVSFRLSRHRIDNGLFREAVENAAADHAWAQAAGPDFGALPVMQSGQYARALVAFGDPRRALEVLDALSPRLPTLPPESLGPLLAVRADALIALARVGEAGTDIERAIRLTSEAVTGSDSVRQVRRRWWLASGRVEEALDDLQAETRRRGAVPGTLAALRLRAEEARLLWAAGRDPAAQATAADVLTRLAGSPERPFARPAEAEAAEVLGLALLRQGQAATAAEPLERAVALRRALQDPLASVQLADALRSLADCRSALGDRAAAAAARTEAGRILPPPAGPRL